MPDLQNFTVTAIGSASVNVPRFTISGQITDSRTGAVLRDFTGANAITFPNVLGTLTAAQRLKVLDLLAEALLRRIFEGL